MAANDYLHNENVDNNPDRITAFFASKSDAYRAMTELKQAGFSNDQIGLAAFDENVSAKSDVGDSQGELRSDLSSPRAGEHQSFWQEVKDFFSGESHDEATDFETSTSSMNWSEDRSAFYSNGLTNGGALVTVTSANRSEARRILEQCNGDLRESGFEKSGSELTGNNIPSGVGRDDVADSDQRSIQLRGELLRAHKERVQSGDVRLRKEVVTEHQTIEVPVTREELVIERTAPTNVSASGEIGSDSEIRIPLSEERVVAQKEVVAKEEVRVGKRQVTSTERVSDNVRHEELKVDNENLTDQSDLDVKDRIKRVA